MDGRGHLILADGMCHVVRLGLRTGSASVSLHCALQDPNTTASGRRARWTAEAFLPQPMVCATWFLWTKRWPGLSVHALCLTGFRYVGEWQAGEKHGRGVYTSANGKCHVSPLD